MGWFLMATCPACLGLVGSPAGGIATTTFLRSWDGFVVVDYTRQERDPFWRSLAQTSLTVYRNFDRFSIGFQIPYVRARGWMEDRAFHRVDAWFGIRILLRKFLLMAPLSPRRPLASAMLGIQAPAGRVIHEDHPQIVPPWAVMVAAGASWFPARQVLSVVEIQGSPYIPGETYTFGRRFWAEVREGWWIPWGNDKTWLISMYASLGWAEGDVGLEEKTATRTRYVWLEGGPGVS